MKVCTRCGEKKPLTEFRRCKRNSDGRQFLCRPCQVARNREYSERHPEYNKRRWRQGYAKNRDAILEKRREWKLNNPEKVWAEKVVYRAIRKGELVRPAQCEKCEIVAEVHAHHPDYDYPLAVEWICARCHGRLHRDEAAA